MEYRLDSDDDSDKPKREEAKTKFYVNKIC